MPISMSDTLSDTQPERRFPRFTRFIDTASPVALAVVVAILIVSALGLIAGAVAWGIHYADQQNVTSQTTKNIRGTQLNNAPKVDKAAADAAKAAADGEKAIAFINTLPAITSSIGNNLATGQNTLINGLYASLWNTYRICIAVGATQCIPPPGAPQTVPTTHVTTPTVTPHAAPAPTPTTAPAHTGAPLVTTTTHPGKGKGHH